MDNHSTKKISLDGFKVLGTDGKVKCILGQKYHHNISKSEPDKSSDKNIIIKIVIS